MRRIPGASAREVVPGETTLLTDQGRGNPIPAPQTSVLPEGCSEEAGRDRDVDGIQLRVEVEKPPEPGRLWVLHRDCRPLPSKPLSQIECVPCDQVRRLAFPGTFGKALRKLGRSKFGRRAATTGPRKGRARRCEVDHQADAARKEAAQLVAYDVNCTKVLKVRSTSCKIIGWTDWNARRCHGGREDPSPREELGEQVISRVLQASFFSLSDRSKRRI